MKLEIKDKLLKAHIENIVDGCLHFGIKEIDADSNETVFFLGDGIQAVKCALAERFRIPEGSAAISVGSARKIPASELKTRLYRYNRNLEVP